MEIQISAQALSFLSSVLLGGAGGLLYDLLGALRRLRGAGRGLTHLLDGLYMLAMGLAMLWFALRVGQGELRIYMALGCLGGIGLYFAALSALLRPLWDFWAGTLAQTLRFVLLPLRFMAREGKKFLQLCKKSFHFHCKYATIKKYRWEFLHLRSRSGSKGGRIFDETHKKERQKEKQHPSSGAAGGADRRGGL